MTCTCCQPLAEAHRSDYTSLLFGIDFPLRIEPTIFAFASRLSADYAGGLWEFYALSNGGFYMAPRSDERFHVRSENGFKGQLSADALGITACLYAFSHLSFDASRALAEKCAEMYHLLREHVLGHDEARSVLAAVD